MSILVFISYSHLDKEFSGRLVSDLEGIGVSVWRDQEGIKPGTPISSSVETALQTADYFLLCLSGNSLRSNWVEREYRAALELQLRRSKPVIIPLILAGAIVPPLLSDIKYIDFTGTYQVGWRQLAGLFPPENTRALRVGGSTGMGSRVLKAFLAELRRSFPSLAIQEVIDISSEISRLVARQSPVGLDAGVAGEMPGEELRGNVDWLEISRDRMVLIVSSANPLWGLHRISETELRNVLLRPEALFVSRPTSSGTYRNVCRYLSQFMNVSELEQLLGRLSLYSIDQVADFVAQGTGVSILPGAIVSDAVAQGKLWAVELPGDSSRSWYGLWNINRERTLAAEHLVSLFKDGLRLSGTNSP